MSIKTEFQTHPGCLGEHCEWACSSGDVSWTECDGCGMELHTAKERVDCGQLDYCKTCYSNLRAVDMATRAALQLYGRTV